LKVKSYFQLLLVTQENRPPAVSAAIKYAYGEYKDTYIAVDHVKVTAKNAYQYI